MQLVTFDARLLYVVAKDRLEREQYLTVFRQCTLQTTHYMHVTHLLIVALSSQTVGSLVAILA